MNCKDCNIVLTTENKVRKGFWCKVCQAKYGKQWRQANKARIANRNKKYRARNKKQIQQYNADYRERNREAIRARFGYMCTIRAAGKITFNWWICIVVTNLLIL